MTAFNRKAIRKALFDRLSGVGGLAMCSMRFRSFDHPSVLHPALFLVTGPGIVDHGGSRPKWTLTFAAFLYMKDASDAGPVDATLDMLDAIEAALDLQPGEDSNAVGKHSTTLGGLVVSAKIAGQVHMEDPNLGDPLGGAVIPIEVVALS